ncbi:M16 family metallopeptidase [Neolewinella antarctica]|uniref:Zn-dependent peptidase n=1 Tax=Neolewinella antarctica TaxID=442734 RepID=A0ABX0XGF9_9BACT|nr:pitrilysin family protein [Neolewinella antarctica]NJC28287.1 putative Zn-dependent peptidase [Neolewinella antarctica]
MRKSPPPIHLATIPALLPAERFTLANGLKVVAMGGVDAPVIRAELIWDAGRPFETGKLVSDLTDDLLLEGTDRLTAADLEAYFEQYGTQLDQADVMDTSNLGISTTHRWVGEVLPMMGEIVASSSFTEESFNRLIRQRQQRLRENLSDNDTLAFRLITEATYGTDHPYGYNSYPDLYETLQLDQIRAYYRSHYHAGNATLFLAGQLNDDILKIVEQSFGGLPTGERAVAVDLPTIPKRPRLLQVSRPRAEQSMIRTGRAGIDIRHPDHAALVVLDTIYGGYFGSRLMRNIREEKGLTYGIESEVDTYRFDGDFGVSADVANESLGAVRQEIALEGERLRQDLIEPSELEMVRAYLSGTVANSLDGVFGHAYRHRAAIIKDYEPHGYLQQLSQTILEITPEKIRKVAQRYLDPAGEWEVVLGGGGVIGEAGLIEDPTARLGL